MNPPKYPSSSGVLCTVCSCPGAGYHYGGLVCRSCRVFFFRAVRSNKPLTCKHNSSCTRSTGPPGRASCAACRFIRCIQANMDILTVGDKIRKSPPEAGSSSQPSTSQGGTGLQDPSSQVSLQLIAMEMSVNSVDISNALNNSFPTVEGGRDYYTWVAETYLSNSTFCPEMASLSRSIRENLIEQNLRLFSLISQKYYSWLSRKLPSNREDPAPLDHIEALFEETAVANGQFIILKLLCLVSPMVGLSSQDKWAVFLVHNRCMSLLFRIVKEEKPLYYFNHISKLLEIPPKLKAFIRTSEDVLLL